MPNSMKLSANCSAAKMLVEALDDGIVSMSMTGKKLKDAEGALASALRPYDTKSINNFLTPIS